MRKQNTRRRVLIPAVIMAAAVVILAVILVVSLIRKGEGQTGRTAENLYGLHRKGRL